MSQPPAPTWNPDFARGSPLFAPLRALADKLPALGWPDAEVLNDLAYTSGRRIVNARGQRVAFVDVVPPTGDHETGFEQRAYSTGEVEVRRVNWHDLLNALVWMAFPTAKAAINARHAQEQALQAGPVRSAARDALTHFDEDGVVVLSADPSLSALLRGFRWKELFWRRREELCHAMRFLVFGHGLYQKALAPFIGMTGKALVFEVSAAVLAAEPTRVRSEADRLVALHTLETTHMLSPAELAPLPVLGVPGWFPDNEHARFYDNTEYFRPGRSRSPPADASE